MVREFAKSLNPETDFQRETRSLVLFRTALADVPDLWIPDVVGGVLDPNVLKMEFRTANG
jgi:ubiquinone biosynthesis protein